MPCLSKCTSYLRFAFVMPIAAGMVGLLAMSVAAAPARADEPAKGEATGHAHMTTIWDVARGGQLYDDWMSVMEATPPEATHPAYPAAGKQKGGGTWRCKECHGWDYKGADGAYSKGSHFTGIKGVMGTFGVAPEKLHEIIMNKTHAFTVQMMPHAAMEKLALFLSAGLIDMDRHIDRETKVARGNAQRGAAFFQTICAVCHGFDGKAMNFKDDAHPEYIGTVANENPWETLHKIRFGQPGVGMVSLEVLGTDDLVDILAYSQTLPEK